MVFDGRSLYGLMHMFGEEYLLPWEELTPERRIHYDQLAHEQNQRDRDTLPDPEERSTP